jgi:anti-anti-sigma factor
LVGEFDLAAVGVFEGAVEQMSVDGGGLTLDLSELSFLDSSGIKAIVACAKALDGRGVLVLVNPSKWVASVLDIVHLDQHAGIEIRRVP